MYYCFSWYPSWNRCNVHVHHTECIVMMEFKCSDWYLIKKKKKTEIRTTYCTCILVIFSFDIFKLKYTTNNFSPVNFHVTRFVVIKFSKWILFTTFCIICAIFSVFILSFWQQLFIYLLNFFNSTVGLICVNLLIDFDASSKRTKCDVPKTSISCHNIYLVIYSILFEVHFL